ncbi:TonB-dependent receptor [Opitutales bacterium]|nr:TonB-dependent receptor [Opitutales bacterium]MDB2681982.1 TonB-dependent receptor [Opitutales bacterium]
MNDLLRLALAGMLAMPLALIGQTTPDTTKPLMDEIRGASAEDEEEDLYVLPEFVVSSDQDEGYYSANSTSVTRTNTLVKNSPISMSIVNEQLLDDLNILSAEDLAMVSASIDEDPNGFSLDRIRIRGFRNSFSRFNFFKRNLPTDPYNIARVDIIKGANSLIFGQASPGGSVSNAPMLANFNKNTKALSVAVGNKDYLRSTFNANQIINDNFAIRVMAVHSEQGYDHQFKGNELDALTVATTMRLTPKTQLRLHFEGVSATNRIPNRSMLDATKFDDSDLFDNSYNGIFSEGAASGSNTSYQVPFSPDWVPYLPEQVMDWIIGFTEGRTNPTDGSNNSVTSRQDLIDHYALINRANYGSVSGPDRFNDRDGFFTMADFTHEINENLQLNLSMNVEQLDANSLKRESYGSVRVKDTVFTADKFNDKNFNPQPNGTQYIRTFWTKNDISTDRIGSRSSLVFKNDWFNAKNRIIVGWDFNTQTKNERFDDQVPVGAAFNPELNDINGAFLPTAKAYEIHREIDNANRAFEFISLSQFGTADHDILNFDEIIDSEVVGEGVNGDPAEWALSKTSFSKVNSNSLWFADQSEFFNGRLHTLMGLRYDYIQIDSSLRKVNYFGYDPGFDDGRNNKTSVTYDKLNPTIGGLFWVNDKIGIFANYAQSIETPSGTERTPLAEMAPPELGEGIEFGVRFDLFSGKLDGQLAYYSITKENDNAFAYSDSMLNLIYPYEIYGSEFPENYQLNKKVDGEWVPKEPGDNKPLLFPTLAGRRGEGDKTISEGVELDFTYNPLPGLSIIGSYNFTIANEILELHPLIPNADDFELFGRPEHRAALTARYKFRNGALKGLTIGASQRYRSATIQTRFDLYYDADNNPVGQPEDAVRTERHYLDFGDEHTTSAFATWEKKLGKKRNSPKLIMGFRVKNLLDNTNFSGRENYGYYRESRSYNLSAKILF